MCVKPYRQGVAEFGCGQCLPCRINRRRLWTHRLVLESRMHQFSHFITLTYSDKELPAGGTLVPRDMQLFLKKLRKAVAPARVRFYGVGEYGDKSQRPHYHLVLFGLPVQVLYGKHVDCQCVVCAAWGRGIVFIGDVTPESAGYVVSYVCKGMTKSDHVELNGRHPEFARMSNGGRSRTGGIGASSMTVVADWLTTLEGARHLSRERDVPSRLRADGAKWPLGRYLRRRLRMEIGADAGEPHEVGELRNQKLQFELSEPGARARREGKRLQVKRRAESLESISRSKKGYGL